MKKLLFTSMGIVAFLSMSFAQVTPQSQELPSNAPLPATVPTAPAKAEMSKEAKAAMKAKQDAEMADAFKGAGLTEAEMKLAKEINANAGAKSTEIKKNDQLTDAEKDAARKAVTDDKNMKLKELMGKDRYKTFSDLRKKQKEANEAAKPAGGK